MAKQVRIKGKNKPKKIKVEVRPVIKIGSGDWVLGSVLHGNVLTKYADRGKNKWYPYRIEAHPNNPNVVCYVLETPAYDLYITKGFLEALNHCELSTKPCLGRKVLRTS